MKRTDKKRKSDSHEETAVVNISTGETSEPGAVSRTFGEPGLEMQACQEPVEPNPQAALKSPAEYVMMAMKGSFTKNKNLLRHVREKHQGMKRTDNETRKRDVTDNEARKQGLLAYTYSGICEESVESNPPGSVQATSRVC